MPPKQTSVPKLPAINRSLDPQAELHARHLGRVEARSNHARREWFENHKHHPLDVGDRAPVFLRLKKPSAFDPPEVQEQWRRRMHNELQAYEALTARGGAGRGGCNEDIAPNTYGKKVFRDQTDATLCGCMILPNNREMEEKTARPAPRKVPPAFRDNDQMFAWADPSEIGREEVAKKEGLLPSVGLKQGGFLTTRGVSHKWTAESWGHGL